MVNNRSSSLILFDQLIKFEILSIANEIFKTYDAIDFHMQQLMALGVVVGPKLTPGELNKITFKIK